MPSARRPAVAAVRRFEGGGARPACPSRSGGWDSKKTDLDDEIPF